tara:strand:+ start:922 stop:1605 length:684 start_codon:yes stop_codon:yes gene_type:complete
MLSSKFTFNNKDYNIYYVDSESAVVKTIKKNKIWEKKLVKVFEKYITKESVVVDVGAFIGSHTIILSNFAKKVISFEPQKLIGECLKKTINNIDNVEFYNNGLGSKKQTLLLNTNNDGGATVVEGKRTKNNALLQYIDKYDIEVVELDSIIKEKIDLIKIDVEGFEFEVLCGAKETIEKYRPIIIIEVFKKNKIRLNEWCKINKYMVESLKAEDYLLLPSVDRIKLI